MVAGHDWIASVAMVTADLDVAGAILAESALSFLGFGVPIPLSSLLTPKKPKKRMAYFCAVLEDVLGLWEATGPH